MVSELKITLKEKFPDIGDVYRFEFDFDPAFKWESGQHAVFFFGESTSDEAQRRVFSIASSRGEEIIRVSTRIREKPSAFKSRLMELRKGDMINMRGPYGSFVITDETANIVGVAGGIGITPFRAILYDIYNGLSKAKAELVYSCKDNKYPFREDINDFEKSENIAIHYVSSRDEVCDALTALEKKYGNRAEYYVSGPPAMVKELKERLRGDSIENVKDDPFLGY
jgi:ferredoxin-NADP reductase